MVGGCGLLSMHVIRRLVVVLLLACCWNGRVRASIVRGRYVTVTLSSDRRCDVRDYGAIGDGKTLDTASIQKALDDETCGTVVVPSDGIFLIRSLQLSRSKMEFHIETGSVLKVSDERSKWPGKSHIISASQLEDVAITGGGTVDGQGLVWWQHRDDFRPHTVQFDGVKRAILRDTHYIDSPNHVLELGCNECEIAAVTVLNPPSTGSCEASNACSHNTDAVDVHGSPFYIHSVNFTTGDDNVAVHANDTVVEDSHFGSGHGASIGSLCDDWIRNVTFRNITFRGTTSAARIKSHPNCTGHVWDVKYEDLTMYDVGQAIVLTQFYEGTGPSTYLFEVAFEHISVSRGRGEDAIDFDCDDHVNNVANCEVTLKDIRFFNSDAGMQCKGVRGNASGIWGIECCL